MASTDLTLLLVLFAVGVSCSKMVKDVGDGRLVCGAEGRFAHPDNCDEYVDCIPGGSDNSLMANAGSCKGGVFNSDVKKCLEPGKDSNCTSGDRQARALTTRDPAYDDLCNDNQSGFSCFSCKSLVNCVNGIAHVEACGAGHTCDERVDFGGGVCYPNSPSTCLCNELRELRPDVYSEQAYIECDGEDTDPIVQMCKKDMIFNDENLMCEFPLGYVECTKRGVFPDFDDCTQYHKCMPVTQGLIQYTFSCPCGYLFNDVIKRCEDPCSFQSIHFTCENEGRYPDEYDCHKFYVCIADDSMESGFRQFHATCPQQSIWRPSNIQGTGSCQISRDISECNNRQAPRCKVPAGRNCTISPDVSSEGSCTQDSANCQCDSATGHLSCEEGFTGDGEVCNSDTCAGQVCDSNAVCVIDTCECLPGFEGDGLVCQESGDTCAGQVCDSNAVCVIDTCECLPGFEGDGLVCQESVPTTPPF